MSTTYIYTDGPDEKPNGKHLVGVLRPADIPGFFVCRMADGSTVVADKAKLKPVKIQEIHENTRPK